MSVFTRLYDWTMRVGDTPGARWVLAAVSFSESAFLPLPVDAVSIPLMLANRHKIWLICLIGTISSVAGGILGYAIGSLLFETVGRWILDLYGLSAAFAQFKARLAKTGWIWVVVGGLTPLPYKVISIAAGVIDLSLGTFLVASIAARGARFGAIGLMLWWFGPAIRDFIQRRAALAGWIVLVLLVGGFVALWFL